MSKKSLEDVVLRMESHLECWKQFNQFLTLARSKKFTDDDESQFLEIKCVITQELEQLLSSVESPVINREEVHAIIGAAPSIRFLSEVNDTTLRNLESQWHKLFINYQALMGQLKVRRTELDTQSLFSGFLKRKKVDK